MEHKIQIVGSIDEESFKEFSSSLHELEYGPTNTIVEIELNSAGGTAIDALAFYSRIINSVLIINVTVYGFCASAAVLVLAACDKRRMTKESWLMVHEDSETHKEVSTSTIERKAKQSRRFEDQWCRLLAGRTTASKETWDLLHKEETYLTADECLKLGIIEEVV